MGKEDDIFSQLGSDPRILRSFGKFPDQLPGQGLADYVGKNISKIVMYQARDGNYLLNYLPDPKKVVERLPPYVEKILSLLNMRILELINNNAIVKVKFDPHSDKFEHLRVSRWLSNGNGEARKRIDLTIYKGNTKEISLGVIDKRDNFSPASWDFDVYLRKKTSSSLEVAVYPFDHPFAVAKAEYLPDGRLKKAVIEPITDILELAPSEDYERYIGSANPKNYGELVRDIGNLVGIYSEEKGDSGRIFTYPLSVILWRERYYIKIRKEDTQGVSDKGLSLHKLPRHSFKRYEIPLNLNLSGKRWGGSITIETYFDHQNNLLVEIKGTGQEKSYGVRYQFPLKFSPTADFVNSVCEALSTGILNDFSTDNFRLESLWF